MGPVGLQNNLNELLTCLIENIPFKEERYCKSCNSLCFALQNDIYHHADS